MNRNEEIRELKRIIKSLERYLNKIEGKKHNAWMEMVEVLKGINEDSIICTRCDESDYAYSIYVLLREKEEESWVSIRISKRNLGFTLSVNKVIKKIDVDYY